jgi:tetratricopeptide (TPR) repeat protein
VYLCRVANLTLLRKILRNLSLATTGMTAVVMTLASLDGLSFLGPLQGPAVMVMSLCWVAYGATRTLAGDKTPGRVIVTAEGPGEELVQKAAPATFATQDGYVAGDKAESRFLGAEKDYADYQYGSAARRYERSIETRASLPAYLNWGAALINTSQFVQAEEVLSIALQLAERLDRREFRAACLANLAVVHSRRGRLAGAQQVCEQAIDLFRMGGDGRGHADVTLTLGNILAHQGQSDAARKAFEAALKRHQMVSSSMGRANAHGNLGNLCLQTGDLEGASTHHRTALGIHEQTGNPVGRANALSNIGNVRFREQKFDEAHKAYTAALDIYRQIEVPLGEASSLGNLGNVLFRQGDFSAALDMYERGLSIHTQIGNPHGRATALTNLGSLLSRMKRRDEALEALYAARKLFDELGVRSRGADAVADLIERLGGGPEDPLQEAVSEEDGADEGVAVGELPEEDVPEEDVPEKDETGKDETGKDETEEELPDEDVTDEDSAAAASPEDVEPNEDRPDQDTTTQKEGT